MTNSRPDVVAKEEAPGVADGDGDVVGEADGDEVDAWGRALASARLAAVKRVFENFILAVNEQIDQIIECTSWTRSGSSLSYILRFCLRNKAISMKPGQGPFSLN